MKRRCTPHVVKRIHKKTRSWRKAADHLNQLYGVSLSHATWRDYAAGKHDIADEGTRALLLLGPRPCPTCGHRPRKRRRIKRKRIPKFGYPTEQKISFTDDLKYREAMR